MNAEKKDLIRSIYVYFFTAVGLIMFLIGAFQLVQFGVKKLILPKYYLQEYQESRCDQYAYPQPMPMDGQTKPAVVPDTVSIDEQKNHCKAQLEEQRQIQQVLDLSSA